MIVDFDSLQNLKQKDNKFWFYNQDKCHCELQTFISCSINHQTISFNLLDLFEQRIQRIYYILINIMMDLYEVLVPLFAILPLIDVVVLKLAIRDTVTLMQLPYQQPQTAMHADQNIEATPFRTTAKHFLLNFTVLEIFTIRRAKAKLSFLLSISIVCIAAFSIAHPFALIFSGTLTYFAYFLTDIVLTMPTKEQIQSKQKNANIHRQKYLQIATCLITIILSFSLVALTFRNFKNAFLSAYITNVGINIALDNFVVRPVACLILALPLSKSNTILEFVTMTQKNTQLLETAEKLGITDVFQNPGKMYSPRKIAKRIPIEIEPVPVDEQMKKREENGYENPLDILKRIKKERALPPINKSLCKSSSSGQCSLNNLFNFNQKEPLSPIVTMSKELQTWSEKTNEVNDELILKDQLKKGTTENMIVIHPSLQEKVQDQQQLGDQIFRNGLLKESTEDRISKDEDHPNFTIQDPLKISLHTSQAPSSRHEPLRIYLNGSQNGNENRISEQNQCQIDQAPRHQTINDNVYHKNSFGVLEIKQQNLQSNQFEDQGIPQNRKRRMNGPDFQLQSKVEMQKKKKNNKRMSCDRVIKFTTGEPYLEYLPNMLSKDHKSKRSQGITNKEIIIESRISNSAKRPYKKKGVTVPNNENRVPEFKIEEL